MLWLIIFSAVHAQEEVLCYGATNNRSGECNSDISTVPPVSSPYVMGPAERVSFYANCTIATIQYPAATIQFSMTDRTVVRVWDAWWSNDSFQLDINNDLLPVKNSVVTAINFFNVLFTVDAAKGFRSEDYAWTEFILENPSEWTIKVTVGRGIPDNAIQFTGFGVQQFIETIPFAAFNRCPFF